jgi:hypothetical protein
MALLLLLLLLQAQRLSWHPSIALWCGNNEIDLSYEWSNSTVLRSNRNMFVVDYQAVFIDTVRKNIKQVRGNAAAAAAVAAASKCVQDLRQFWCNCSWHCGWHGMLFDTVQSDAALFVEACLADMSN